MWNPNLLFSPPEEEKEEEVIDEGNIEIGSTALAPGTTAPTEDNIETNTAAGDTNVTTISAGDSDLKGDAALQKQLLQIAKMTEQVPKNNKKDQASKDFLNFIGKSLEESNVQKSKLDEAALIEEEVLTQAQRDAANQIELNLPNDKPFDFSDQDALDSFVQKTFDDLFKKDKDINRIQRTIIEENKDLLAQKQKELQEKLSKYKTFVFPKNYFSAIGNAMVGRRGPAIDYDEEGVSFTPDQEKLEKELEVLNSEYSAFANDLIKKDPRFLERIEFIEKGISNTLSPLIQESEQKAAIKRIREKRQDASWTTDRESIDNLGFGLNVVKLTNFMTGGSEDSWVRGLEEFFGYEEYELSDAAQSGLEMLSVDKFSQTVIIKDFARDMDYYNSFTHEGDADKWNNRENKVEHGKGNNTYNLYSRKNLLPEGDDSFVWYNKETGEWKSAIGNYTESNGKGIPLYINPLNSFSTATKPKGYMLKALKEKGWEMMTFGEAKPLIEGDLDKKQKRILDRAVELIDKEAENGNFTQEKFTDFLSNMASGNVKDALRYLPKVILKQVPYMAANFMSAGTYTMVSEGGNIGFDIVQAKAAESLGVDPNKLTGQQMLDWMETNPEEFDKALAIGMGAGGLIAGLERAGIGYIIKSAKFGTSAFTQLIKGNLKKALTQGKALFSNNIKSGLNESLTEGAQTGVEQLALGKFNAMEYVESMGEGFLGGVLLPGLGSFTAAATNQVIELAKNTRLNLRDPKFYAKVDGLFKATRIQLDQELKDGKITDKVYEQRLQEISNDRSALLKIPTYFDVESKSETFDIFNSIKEKQKELEAIGDNKGLGKPLVDEITVLNERLGEIYSEQGLNRQIGSLNALVDAANDVTMQTFDTKTEADNFIEEQNKTGSWDSKASKDGSGVILQNKETGKQLIIVNKETAAEVRDIAVADHEFLHALMFQTVKDNPKAQAAIGKSLLGYLEKMDKDGQMTELLQERYKSYKGLPVEQQYEEALNFFADAIINEEIKVNDGVVEKIGRLLRNLLQSLPFVNISFKSNKDVYNFVKDYALRRRSGKGLNAAQKRMLTRGATVGKNLGKGTSSQIADMIENQGGNLNKAFAPQSKRTAQDLMLEYQQEGANMQAELVEDLVNQYYSLGLKAMGYSKEAGDIAVEDALNFLNTEFPSIAKNYTETNNETGRQQSLSNYIKNTIGPRGSGFFKAEIEQKKRTVSKEKLEDKGRQIVDTDQQSDFDQKTKGDKGRAKVFPNTVRVIADTITGETRAEQQAMLKNDIQEAILRVGTNPKAIAQYIVEKTKTKEYRAIIKAKLGRFGSQQYADNVFRLFNNKDFIKAIPVANIKRRFGKLFGIKQIDTVKTKKVEDGKTTYYDKQVYSIPAITKDSLNKIRQYFLAGEKRSQSLFEIIGEGVAVESMQELKADETFMKELQNRLEFKKSNLTASEFMDQIEFDLDKRNLEDKSFDVSKASERKTKVQRITGKSTIDLLSGSYETNIDKITKALSNIKSVPLVSVTRVEKGKNEKFGAMYEWTAIIPNSKGETDYEDAQTYGEVRNEMVLDLIESFPPKDRQMVRQLIFDMSTNQLVVSGKPGQVAGADAGNLALYGAKSEFDKSIPTYPNIKNKKGKDITTPIITRKRYTDGDKKITNKIWDTITSESFQVEQDRKIPVLFKIIDGLNKLKGNKNFPWFIKALTASVSNSQKHPFRHLMPLRNVQVDPTTDKPFNETYREEHSFVANNLGKLIEYGILSNQLPIIKDIIKASASQAAITEATDNKLPKSKTSAMGALFSKVIEGIVKGERQPAFQGIVSFSRYMEDGLLNIGEFWNLKENKLLVDVLGFDLKGINNNADSRNARTNLINKALEDKLTIPKAQAELKAANKVNTKQSKRVKINKENLFDLINADGTTEASIEAMSRADKAIQEGNKLDKPRKGISVFDFDDTLAYSDSKVIVTLDGKTFKITPSEFAQQSEVLEREGAVFNFKEFNKVVKGKKGPLADLALKRQDKFGSGDIFVLTARPQASAVSIQKFLKGIGLNLPLKNITGLENGSPEAKALWVVDKAADGYNDFYFADDALPNVQAVKNVLDQIDVKSDVQIAKQSKRDRINKDFNIIIEQQSGKEWFKTYSKARATVEGKKANRFEFFIPPSAEDFVGLLYKLLPDGKNGDMAFEWMKDHLINPYNKAEQTIIAAKITVANDFNSIRNSIDNIPKNLTDQAGYSNFTYSQALRVYIWNMQGMDVPGLSQRDKNALVKLIEKDSNMKVFAEKIAFIQKGKDYPAPMNSWVGGSITGDIINSIQKTFRKEALQEWQQNVDIIFSEENMYKLEALYGSNLVTSLNNMLLRMKRGSNRSRSENKQVENVMDWINNSVGTTMFLNRKTGILQLLSSVNFINWEDNNIVAAGKAFANQPQYWKDVMYLLNSDYLVQRRNGLKINVAESEIAEASKKGGLKGVIAYMLNKGFIFTRIADSLAIATGGATFYRNRVNSLQKQVNIDTGKLYTKAEAETKAFDDFYKISEETQQSSQPDRISMQQASGLGRVVLNYANTPMQYARIIKRSTQDLFARRGDWKKNVSRIIYYSTVQNLIFSALQAAIFTILFDEEEEQDRTMSDKAENIGFGMLSTLLRGTGYGGALVDTLISMGREISIREDGFPSFGDDFAWNMFDFSPSVDTKVRKIRAISRTFKYNRDQIKRRGFNLENPAYIAFGELVSATINVPLDRALRMAMALKQASDKDTAQWQKWALLIGYSSWSLNLPYWGTTTTLANEEREDEEIKTKYKNDARKLKGMGYKRIPMTKGKPAGKIIEDYIEVTRPTGDIEYWLTPKK